MASEKTRFLLLDRDGVINRRIPGGYVTSWEKFAYLPRALESLQLLARRGYAALIVSNQACVGKGLLSWKELDRITQQFVDEVLAAGGDIRGVYYCTHLPSDRCACRKPQPGLLQRAQREHGFDFTETFVVGDSESDIEAARRVGSPSVLVSSRTDLPSRTVVPGLSVVHDLYEAAELILTSDLAGIGALAGFEGRGKR